jgi:peptidoglycan hydrolase-like protein with peptidoglycan-binding domain
MAAYTVLQIQQALVDQHYLEEKDQDGNTNVDGSIGPVTTAAVMQYQIDKGISPADGNLNSTLASKIMNNYQPPAPVTLDTAPNILGSLWNTFKLPDIGAGLEDYILNFATSKINLIAGVMAVAIIGLVNGWLNNFGIQLPASATAALTTAIAAGGMGLIWLCRTFFNKPKVAAAMPLKVTSTKSA